MSSAAIRSWTFGPSMPEGGGDRFRSRFSHQAARADHLAARCAVNWGALKTGIGFAPVCRVVALLHAQRLQGAVSVPGKMESYTVSPSAAN